LAKRLQPYADFRFVPGRADYRADGGFPDTKDY
jgi:hypothetical protein